MIDAAVMEVRTAQAVQEVLAPPAAGAALAAARRARVPQGGAAGPAVQVTNPGARVSTGIFAALSAAGTPGDLGGPGLEPTWGLRARMGRWSARDLRAACDAFCAAMVGVETELVAAAAWRRLRRGLELFLAKLPRIRGGAGPMPAGRKAMARAMRLSRDGQQGKAAQALATKFFSDADALKFAAQDLRAGQEAGPPATPSGPVGATPDDDEVGLVMAEMREAAASAPRHRGAGPSGLLPDALHAAIAECGPMARIVAQFGLLGMRWGPPAWLAAAEGAVIVTNDKARLISSPEAFTKLVERWQSQRLKSTLRGLTHAGAPFKSGSAAALGIAVQCAVGSGHHVIVGDGSAAYNTVHHVALIDAAPEGTFSAWMQGMLQRRAVALKGSVLAVPTGRGAGLGGPLMVAAYSLAMDKVAAVVAARFRSVVIRFYLDDCIVSGVVKQEVEDAYAAIKAELARVGITQGVEEATGEAVEASAEGPGRGKLLGALGVPVGGLDVEAITKRFTKAQALLSALADVELDCALRMIPIVPAKLMFDASVASGAAHAASIDGGIDKQFCPRLEVTVEQLRAPASAGGLGLKSVAAASADAVRGLGLRMLGEGAYDEAVWAALAEVKADPAKAVKLPFAHALYQALTSDGWSVCLTSRVTRFQGEVCTTAEAARVWSLNERSAPLPEGHPTGPSLAAAFRGPGACPRISQHAILALVKAQTAFFFETDAQIAAHGPCQLCGRQGGGRAHGRVCPKIPTDVKWAIHHAIGKAIAGFAARTRLCGARREQPMSTAVRADVVLTDSKGAVTVAEIKTYVKACESHMHKGPNVAAKEKAAEAVRQYVAAPSCAGIVTPFVIDSCSLRFNQEGAQLLANLQRERDELGSSMPDDNQPVIMLVVAAAAEAAGRVDFTYKAMCAGVARRGGRWTRGMAGPAAAAAQGTPAESAAQPAAEAAAHDAGGHASTLSVEAHAPAGTPAPLGPHPPPPPRSQAPHTFSPVHVQGRAPTHTDTNTNMMHSHVQSETRRPAVPPGGRSPAPGPAFGPPPPAPSSLQSRPQVNHLGGQVAGGAAGRYSKSHPHTKVSGGMSGAAGNRS